MKKNVIRSKAERMLGGKVSEHASQNLNLQRRALACVRLTVFVAGIFILNGCVGLNGDGVKGTGDVLGEIARVRTLSLLTINLRGGFDVPCDSQVNDYVKRYGTIADDLKKDGLVPDVIALQEVTGWMWCMQDHKALRDYTLLDQLLQSLKSGTGIQYRIAYMTAPTYASGNVHCSIRAGRKLDAWNLCHLRSGQALLYNPARINNRMTSTLNNEAIAHDAPIDNVMRVRRSLPACDVAPGSNVARFIDGPPQTDKCNTETPGGLAWSAIDGISFARLELRDTPPNRPNAAFNVYNVHLVWIGDPNYNTWTQAMRNAVTDMENRFSTPRLIPPIVLGDFNVGDPRLFDYVPATQFEIRGRTDDFEDVIWSLTGKSDAFPNSMADIDEATSVVFPKVPVGTKGCQMGDFPWTDHCSILTTLKIRFK